MKKISMLFLCVVMIFVSGCNKSTQEQTTDFEYKTIELYPTGQEILLGEATISVPLLKKYLDNPKYADEYFENRYLDIEYYWGKEILAIASSEYKNKPEDFKPFLMKETYEVAVNTDEFISIVITARSDIDFLDGQKSAVSFSKKTGEIITLDEIFKNTDYKEVIKNEIKEIIKNDTKNLYVANAQRTVDLIFDDVNYYLTKTDLIFLFPANSVASGNKGSIPFVFSLNELDKKVGLNK